MNTVFFVALATIILACPFILLRWAFPEQFVNLVALDETTVIAGKRRWRRHGWHWFDENGVQATYSYPFETAVREWQARRALGLEGRQ